MRKLYCYSHQEFDNMMTQLGWENRPGVGVSTISISSLLDEPSGHWFNLENGELPNNINLDFNDVDPNTWWDVDYYDEALDCYFNEQDEKPYFNITAKIDNTDTPIHALDYNEAVQLAEFIDDRIKAGDDIYVHCSAGASRSQAVVRYILDTYPDIKWKTRDENPCLTPNWHVVRMLKRANRILF